MKRKQHDVPDDELSDLEPDDEGVGTSNVDLPGGEKPKDYFKTMEMMNWNSGAKDGKNRIDKEMFFGQRDYKSGIRKGRRWLPFLERT